MEVVLGGNLINVSIVRKNNKNVYFRFKDDELVVTANRLVSEAKIEKLIMENERSLLRMYNHVIKKNERDLQFCYLGNPYTRVFDESVKEVYLSDGMLYAKNERMFELWYKRECERVFSDRINVCLELFRGIPKFSLRIRNMKTRWGVNNVTKNIITLNSELLKKDISLIDYVIVHELCHFYEANHSDRFWYQVSLRYPNYKLARKMLRG